VGGLHFLAGLPLAVDDKVASEGDYSGEPKRGIYVSFNYVESKIIKSAKTPNRNREKYRDSKRRTLKNQQGTRQQSKKKKEKPLDLDRRWTRDLLHGLTHELAAMANRPSLHDMELDRSVRFILRLLKEK
jgi:hypothetical protein